MNDRKVDALLALRSDGRLMIGRERIALLEAVIEHGSITQAAQAAGFSYKAAWDAVSAINNLLPRPAFVTRSGGRRGGGAEVTEEGRRLISAFRRLEEKLARISEAIAKDGLDSEEKVIFWGLAMRTSARNAFHCTVTEIRRAPVNVEVGLRVSDSASISAVITNESVDTLGLAPGQHVVALVKSCFVGLAQGKSIPKLSAENRILGAVVERVDGGVNAEITLDIGEGKTLISVITRDAADELGLQVGSRACAFFAAQHVILAAD